MKGGGLSGKRAVFAVERKDSNRKERMGRKEKALRSCEGFLLIHSRPTKHPVYRLTFNVIRYSI
jgi:hypothetical protein